MERRNGVEKSEKAYRDSTAVKIKTWGNALRNTRSFVAPARLQLPRFYRRVICCFI